jgi:hypothetical protein
MVGVPLMVMVFADHDAVKPSGKPVAVPMPVAPVVAICMGVMVVPVQTSGLADAAPAVFTSLTVTTVFVDVAVQPPLEKLTLYVPLSVTTMDGVVAPFDQVIPVAAEDVKVTEPPSQKVVGPDAVMVGVVIDPVTLTAGDVEAHAPLVT